MKEKICALAAVALIAVTSASCGFKSDLYLPGKPQKIEQYDTESLQDLGEEKLLQLQNRTEETVPVVHSATPQDSDNVDSEPTPDGVVLELPTIEELKQKESSIRKKKSSSGIRKKPFTLSAAYFGFPLM